MTPAPAVDHIRDLEQVRQWLSQETPGDWLDWRFFIHAGAAGIPLQPVQLVIWDADEAPCSKCRRTDRKPCPVALDSETGQIRNVLIAHDCGTERAPARHVTRLLTEIDDRDDVRRLLQSLDQYRPIELPPLSARRSS